MAGSPPGKLRLAATAITFNTEDAVVPRIRVPAEGPRRLSLPEARNPIVPSGMPSIRSIIAGFSAPCRGPRAREGC